MVRKVPGHSLYNFLSMGLLINYFFFNVYIHIILVFWNKLFFRKFQAMTPPPRKMSNFFSLTIFYVYGILFNECSKMYDLKKTRTIVFYRSVNGIIIDINICLVRRKDGKKSKLINNITMKRVNISWNV